MPNLPHPQVQALAGCYTDLAPQSRYETVLYNALDERVVDLDIRALALEVLASRERRCQNCRWMSREETYRGSGVMGDYCLNLESQTDGRGFSVTPDWFCADFQPKEPK